VAVSSGLLRGMSRAQIEAVLGHEMSHGANGDMVTLALLQGVLNTFVIFLARIIGSIALKRSLGEPMPPQMQHGRLHAPVHDPSAARQTCRGVTITGT
jgi:Zn-dependent protease with chaperone function